MADAQTPVLTDDRARYRFLLGFLIERGVLTDKRYGSGTWCLRGVYGVDDSGLKGAGRSPEEALDNAIVAVNLDPASAQKFWSATHEVLAAQAPSQPDRAVMQQALDALTACIDYGAMTGSDWVAEKARVAIAALSAILDQK